MRERKRKMFFLAWGLKSSDSLPLFLSSLLFIISAFLCFCFSIFFCTFDMLVLLCI